MVVLSLTGWCNHNYKSRKVDAFLSKTEREIHSNKQRLVYLLFILLIFPALVSSQDTPQPAKEVLAFDTPSDAGKSITIQWQLSPDDGEGLNNVLMYEILRSASPEAEYTKVGDSPRGTMEYVDNSAKDKTPYYYKIRALTKTNSSDSVPSSAVVSTPQWFKKKE